jgi:hypothetical protein
LAGHPEGRACIGDLTRCVSILMSSGPDWTDRIKRLAARAPELDIFGSAFVLRDDRGWQVTDAGRQFLVSLETLAYAENHQQQLLEANVSVARMTVPPIQPPALRLVVDNVRTSQSDLVSDQTRRTA